jgi:release factor glutamine methyltransferase
VQTVSALLTEAARALRAAGIEDARSEARWLLGRALGLSASALILQADAVPPSDLASRFRAMVERRAAHEPFAYVVGEREFYGREFLVDGRVLVPRPETETLIEAALAILTASSKRNPLAVDVGTGSGAIACTIAREAAAARVVACDVSPDALAVAAANRDRLGLAGRLPLVRGSLLSWLREPADLVLANLPYIPSARVPALMPEVAEWEPHLALDGGADGLDLVRTLLADAPRIVRPGGTILLELDPEQMAPAAALLPAATSTVIRDLAGLDRVLRLDLPT